MTRTLFLHAGPPKTGSTSIQTFFHGNAAAFLRQGLFRPNTGTEIHGHLHLGLVNAFIAGHAAAPATAKLAAELRAHGLPPKVFLSAEMFAARLASKSYATALKAFCRDLGYRLHVIVFIRPQAPLLNSLFTQHVKNWRLVDSIEAFLATETGNFRHHYAALLRHLLNDLSIDLTVLPFNRATLSGGLGTAMCQVMELDAAATGLVQPDGANPSPGPRTVAAFQRLRRKVSSEFPGLGQDQLAPLTRPLLHAAGALGWNAENFGGFSPSQTRWIIECFKSDNDALAQRVWSKPWDQVFSEAETLSPPFNIFSPADAPPPQRIEFRGFINQSMATIAEFGSTHHGHGKRM